MEPISKVLSSLGRTPSSDARALTPAEIKARVRSCSRLFAAWPNARPASLDLTLLEYVNATRGIPLEHLPGVISDVIAAGGEFLPPAGAVLERCARFCANERGYSYNPNVSGDDQIEMFRTRALAAFRAAQRTVEPLCIEEIAGQVAGIEAGLPRPALPAPRRTQSREELEAIKADVLRSLMAKNGGAA